MNRLLKDIWALLFILVVLFFSTTLKGMAGLTNKYFFIFLIAVTLFNAKKILFSLLDRKNTIMLLILVLSFLLVLFKKSISQPYTKVVFDLLIVPLIIALVADLFDEKQLRIVRTAMLVFYITECSIAIVERIWMINIFSNPFVSDLIDFYNMDEKYFFRSTALIGHPLRNSLVVSTAMAFISTDRFITIRRRLLLCALGLISLFCFNGRTAILIVAVTVVPYLSVEYLRSHKTKFFYLIAIVALILVALQVLSTTSLGGRLFHEGLDDGSLDARILALTFNDYITSRELWQGGLELYGKVQEALGTPGVENGVVCLILSFGLAFTILLLPLLIIFHWKKLQSYSLPAKWVIMIVFYIIGVANPNLSQQPGWIFWMLFFYAFEPDNRRQRLTQGREEYRFRSLNN